MIEKSIAHIIAKTPPKLSNTISKSLYFNFVVDSPKVNISEEEIKINKCTENSFHKDKKKWNWLKENTNDIDNNSCGVYCKNLSQTVQKELIFRSTSPVWINSFREKYNRVIPTQWWKVWWDYVNIEFKSLSDHFQFWRELYNKHAKCSMKEPLSTMKISEESDIDSDIKSLK